MRRDKKAGLVFALLMLGMLAGRHAQGGHDR
jgi:hypothetical protein